MRIDESEKFFRDFVEKQGKTSSSLSPHDLVTLGFEFYETVRAEDALPLGEEMGDALLYQWGICPAFAGHNDAYFYLDLTRQFIAQDEQDDDAIFQLMCKLKYQPNDELRTVSRNDCSRKRLEDSLASTGLDFSILKDTAFMGGNHWCKRIEDLLAFKEFVYSHPAFLAASRFVPTEIEISFSGV